MPTLSPERVVFSPLERLARAFHPYRWHLVFVALSASAVFCVLAYAADQHWTAYGSRILWYAAPVLANVVIWAWGARLLVAWYGPRRTLPILRHVPPEILDPLAPLKRVWHLVVLVAFLLCPGLLWLVWFKVPPG